MDTLTYMVPEFNLTKLQAGIEALNRRCRRLGVPEITLTTALDHVRARCEVLTVNGGVNTRAWLPASELVASQAHWPIKDTGERASWLKVEVVGASPVLPGDWKFVAVLEPMVLEGQPAENLVRTLPGEMCPVNFRTVVGYCDHCRTTRRRSQTFVVRGNGEHRVVGRQCLKDFLGYHANPDALASQAELLASLDTLFGEAQDEEGSGSQRVAQSFDLCHVLSIAAARIRTKGWVSRGKSRENAEAGIRGPAATADVVQMILTPPSFYNDAESRREHEALVAECTPIEADVSRARAAIEWAEHLDAGDSDYLYNCNLVARVGTVDRRTLGITCSILVAYVKHLDQEIERAARASKPESRHVGTVGVRIPLIWVTCDRVILTESEWGVTGIHKMHDDAGNDLTWFASGGEKIAAGARVAVAATIKEHGDWHGRAQTTVTRVIQWTEEGLAADAAKKARRLAREANAAAKLTRGA